MSECACGWRLEDRLEAPSGYSLPSPQLRRSVAWLPLLLWCVLTLRGRSLVVERGCLHAHQRTSEPEECGASDAHTDEEGQTLQSAKATQHAATADEVSGRGMRRGRRRSSRIAPASALPCRRFARRVRVVPDLSWLRCMEESGGDRAHQQRRGAMLRAHHTKQTREQQR